jgi:hypothetical protein
MKEAFKRIGFKKDIEKFIKPYYANDKYNFKAYISDIQDFYRCFTFINNNKRIKEENIIYELAVEQRKAEAIGKFLLNTNCFNPFDGNFYSNRFKGIINEKCQNSIVFKNEKGLIRCNDDNWTYNKEFIYYMNIDNCYIEINEENLKELAIKQELRKAYAIKRFLLNPTRLNPKDGKYYKSVNKNGEMILEVNEILEKQIYRDAEGLIFKDEAYVFIDDCYLEPERGNRLEKDIIERIKERMKLIEKLSNNSDILLTGGIA